MHEHRHMMLCFVALILTALNNSLHFDTTVISY